jgi:RND family efflux transporter MFP subunit
MNTYKVKNEKSFWVGLICGFATVFCTGCEKTSAPSASVQTVSSATVQEIRPEAPERYSATIAPFAQVELAFKSPGIVEQLEGQAGEFVRAGTELARVRQVDYQQRVQQSQEQARAAESQVAQLEVAIQQAETDFQRASRLYQSASLTKPEYEQAKTRLESLTAQAAGARANVAAAHSVVSQANLTLADTSLRAPFSGWITARNVEKGSLVGNATPGFSMVDTHIVKAIFAVPDTSLKSIRMGQRLTVMLDALQRPVNGTVSAISPQADPRTHVFSVEVSIANANNEVRPGMIGSLTLGDAPSPTPRLVVPLSAVVRAPGNPNGFAVFRVQDRGGKTFAVAQSITPGGTYGNAIEVLNGVSAGERIVGLGGDLLRDGQEVRVLP